jgi:hypothetical protein
MDVLLPFLIKKNKKAEQEANGTMTSAAIFPPIFQTK